MYPSVIDAAIAQRFAAAHARDLDEPVRIVLARHGAGDWSVADADRVPDRWRLALACQGAPEALDILGWGDLAPHLPATLALLRERLAGLGVLLPQSQTPSLLYFYVVAGDVQAFEGLPAQAPEADALPRPTSVATVQRVHDGWYDSVSGDLGWLPEAQWQVIGQLRADDARFIGMASKGSALVGFEAGTPGQPAHVLWPDEGLVESPAGVFDSVDTWAAAALQPADRQR